MPLRGIPLHSIKRLIAEETELRVSLEAREAMKEFLEDLTKRIGEKAITFAKHSDRNTILEKDIDLAIKEIDSKNL
jgi:histone H3/H4